MSLLSTCTGTDQLPPYGCECRELSSYSYRNVPVTYYRGHRVFGRIRSHEIVSYHQAEAGTSTNSRSRTSTYE
eukprot:scaffold406296_cov41-Prasinocladus_malaysianus.AAC.1